MISSIYAPVDEMSSVYFHPFLIRKRWMMVFVITLVHHHNHHHHHMSSTDSSIRFGLARVSAPNPSTLLRIFLSRCPHSEVLLSHFVLSSCAIATSIDVHQNDKETLIILNLKFHRARECERFYGGLKMHQHLCEV